MPRRSFATHRREPLAALRPAMRAVRSRRIAACALFALAASAATPARAQIDALEVALVIRNARVLTADGRTLDGATIICRKGRIETIAKDPELPFLKRIIEAEGRTVTPGLIDVAAPIGERASRGSNPTLDAADAFDRYAVEAHRETLRHGVTALAIQTGGGVGLHGKGVLVRLEPGEGDTIGDILARDVALRLDLGSTLGGTARIRTLDAVQRQFEAAKAHREALETYREELAEYEKKLAERVEKQKKEKEEEAKKGNGAGGKRPGAATPPAPPAAPAAAQKPEELKKPQEPRRNDAYDVLLAALDGELDVHIEAHESADILNAVELADELGFRLTLVGATEAHLVADALPSGTRVILGGPPASEVPGELRASPELAATLRAHDVEVLYGSVGASDSRFLAFGAQIASAGESSARLLERLTAGAARFLGVDREIGRLRRGMRADLVVWSSSGDPFEAGTRPLKVVVGGKLAFDAEEDSPE